MGRYPRLGVRINIYLLSRSYSRILDITGRRLIGLYDGTSVGFPGFGIIMIFACFKRAGQYSSLNIALNKCWRVCSPSRGISCIIRAVMRSESGALCGFSCLITCLSSLRVKA